MKKKTMSTPMVLAASSAMVVIGLVAWMVGRAPDQARVEQTQRARMAELRIDDRTAESVAESFYDAWRRRAWDEAEGIAVGEARERVLAKRAAEADVNPEDREMAREAWQALAGAPLTVYFQQSETLEEDRRIAFRGIAAYDLVGQPYRREVEFVVVRAGEVWRVERMEPGRVITDVPALLELGER
ncbi:MAG: hypothetical protein M3Y87_18750 [Myxococcota bacterium]|nr:hypothetical protein [Myxococcota bacterium]